MKYNPIYTRRSIRKYKQTDISKKQIEEIIEAGIAAPSAKNRQPWKCIVMKNQSKDDFLKCMEQGIAREKNNLALLPKSRNDLPDASHTLQIMKTAPVIIAIINTNGTSPFSQLDAEERFTEICDSQSIGAFIQNMLIQAEAMGIGTLWIANTCFAYNELVSFLHVEGQLIGAVALGYADETPNARPRKPINDIAEFRD